MLWSDEMCLYLCLWVHGTEIQELWADPSRADWLLSSLYLQLWQCDLPWPLWPSAPHSTQWLGMCPRACCHCHLAWRDLLQSMAVCHTLFWKWVILCCNFYCLTLNSRRNFNPLLFEKYKCILVQWYIPLSYTNFFFTSNKQQYKLC